MLLASTVAAIPAFASDGVVEVNQSCAIGGGCFSGDAPLFPVTINGSAGKSYRLTSDIRVPDHNTTAIAITQSGVSLDLNGFSILGITTCSFLPYAVCSPVGSGVGVDGPGAVEVHNGTVQGMGAQGIRLSFDSLVTNVRVLNSGATGISVDGGGNVRGVVASANGGNGVNLVFRGALTDSVVGNNGAEGILAGQGSRVHGTVADYNKLNGIRCTGDCLLTANAVTNNSQYGLAAPAPTCTGVLAYGQNLITDNAVGPILNSTCGIPVGTNACGLLGCP